MGQPSPRVRQEFLRAIDNIVSHAKRSVLDYVEFMKFHTQDPKVKDELDVLMKRLHNDISIIRDQTYSVFMVYETDGVIPPFGRTREQIDSDSRRTGSR